MEFKQVENLGRDVRDTFLRLLRDYSEALGLAFLIAILLRVFVVAAFRISAPAMEPSVKVGDFVIGFKLPFGLKLPYMNNKFGNTSPARGDLVFFDCPNKKEQMCLRRVVAVSGDKVELLKKRLYVNDVIAKYGKSEVEPTSSLISQIPIVALNESWQDSSRSILISTDESQGDFSPFMVPPGAFFSLADNRDFTEDSRHWGAIPNSSIEARAVFVWLSIEWYQGTDGVESKIRWDRIFKTLN
jgi:signal peptidase I